MPNKLINKIFAIAILLSVSLSTIAQSYFINTNETDGTKLFNGIKDYRTWSIGLNVGSMMPISAFGGKNDFSNWESNFGYGINVNKQISHVLGLQAEFLKGVISANNDRLWNGAAPESPFKSFKTDINWTASFNVVATLANINWSNAKTYIKPFVSIGLGNINYSPHLVNNDNSIFPTKTDQSNFYIPIGLGAKLHVTQTLNIVGGYTVGIFDGDYLDGYYKAPYLNDHFSYGHIGVEFIIGNKSKPQLARYNAPRHLQAQMEDKYMNLRQQFLKVSDDLDVESKELTKLNNDISVMKRDTDGDGVSDYFDKCPNTMKGSKVDGSGCVIPAPPSLENRAEPFVDVPNRNISQGDLNVMYDASEHLEFETGKATLKEISYSHLHRIVDILMRKALNIKLVGYTDNIGSESFNKKLSKARAETVKSYLIKNGIHEEYIVTEGRGSDNPIASNKTKQGRRKNRRVEFSVY